MAGPPVYSTRFIEGFLDLASSSELTYVVPAGYRAIVVDIAGVIANAGLDVGGVQVFLSGGSTFFSRECPPGAEGEFHWHGRQVFNPGETIAANVFGVAGSMQLFVSGYLLSAPLGP